MNIESIEIHANRLHKGTMAILEKLTGMPEDKIPYLPIIACSKGKTRCFTPSTTQGGSNPEYIASYIINGAFSLEIKIKYLHALETGCELKGHKLLELFSELTTETKQFIRDDMKRITKTSQQHKELSKQISQHVKKFSWDAHKLLSNSDMAFERWRYLHEGKGMTWFAGYGELQECLNNRIQAIKQ